MVLMAHQSYIGNPVVGVWVEGDWKWGHHRGAHRMVAGFGKRMKDLESETYAKKKKKEKQVQILAPSLSSCMTLDKSFKRLESSISSSIK